MNISMDIAVSPLLVLMPHHPIQYTDGIQSQYMTETSQYLVSVF